MSKLSKRVDALEKYVKLLAADVDIVTHAGELHVNDDILFPYPFTVNRRHTTTKRVLLELLRHLGLEIQDSPPQKSTFSLIERVEEVDDE